LPAFSFEGRNGVSRGEAGRGSTSAVDGAAPADGIAGAGDGSHTGSGLALQAFPQRRESFLYRHPFDGDGDQIPKSLMTRNLSSTNDLPSVNVATVRLKCYAGWHLFIIVLSAAKTCENCIIFGIFAQRVIKAL
jgi:hypothetical protein